MRRAYLLMALVAGMFFSSSCGEYSFLLVTMKPDPADTGIDPSLRMQVRTCNVSLTGAVNDSFNLEDCGGTGTPTLSGTFEYSTLVSSGDVTVQIDGLDSNGQPLVTGTATGSISAGRNAEITVLLKRP